MDFLKGDEIIKFTAEVIVSNVHQEIPEGSFVGHIGGDDFVAIIPTTQCDKICQDIISTFDTNVLKFFTPEDIERGYIEVANRKRNNRTISTNISINRCSSSRCQQILQHARNRRSRCTSKTRSKISNGQQLLSRQTKKL